MEIKPIRSDEDYENTLKKIESLWDSPDGTPESDALDVMITLVESYEAEHYPTPEIDDPVGVIEFYMEIKGLTRSDLIPYIGEKARVSDIFSHKRELSKTMIRRLHDGLGIPADLLIGKPKVRNLHGYGKTGYSHSPIPRKTRFTRHVKKIERTSV